LGKRKSDISALKSWTRSIRLDNLLGLAIGVMLIRYSYFQYLPSLNDLPSELLFVLPILLISAGGTIINDYFDIREDRLKRPDRAHIGRTLKRRVALVSHWGLTALGLFLAFILSSQEDTLLPFFIALIAAIVLFLYSTWFKGRILIGNIAIAGVMTAFVPFALSDIPMKDIGDAYDWFCVFIFTTILIRQLAKDLIDYEVDKKSGLRTLPVAFGPKASWRLIYILEAWLIFITSNAISQSDSRLFQAFFCITLLSTLFFSVRKKPQALSAWLKLMLASGLIWVVLY
jgi:4-hydroxybenzoate polyprenyltransferase